MSEQSLVERLIVEAGELRPANPELCGDYRLLIEAAAELSRLTAEVERLKAVIAGDATLAGMHFETGTMHMGLKSPLVPVMADALAKMVDGSNYVEMTFKHQQTGDEYLLHCQRLSRPTPHQLRQRAEAERDQALEVVRELKPDAERYLWLRDHELSPWAAVRAGGAKTPADIDAAIDEARSK